MAKDKIYYQCIVQKGKLMQIAWLDKEQAVPGLVIDIYSDKDGHQLWSVEEVGTPNLSNEVLEGYHFK